MVLCLVCAGLTGSILTWNAELEKVFAPQLFIVPKHAPNAKTLDPFELRDLVSRQFPDARIDDVPLRIRLDEVADYQLDYPQGGDVARPDDHVFVDPVTGKVLGSRRDGDLRQGLKNLMPFIDSLHEELALGDVGRWTLGIASLLWTLQCFTGLYLSLPLRRAARAQATASWWSRWRPSWRIRTFGDFKKINFDVHRAGSLWLWGVLLMFSWSAMSFNLAPVYNPIAGFFGYGSALDGIADDRDQARVPAMNWRQAYAAAVSALNEASTSHRFSVLSERLMMYRADKHIYEYRVQTTRDVESRGNTRLFIHADTGRLLGLDLPRGTWGNSFTTWIEALHEGMVFGNVYRFCVSVFGVLIAILSIAGLAVWIGKSRPRRSITVSSRR